MGNYKEILNQIDTFVFDVDGVFTNGMLSILSDGILGRTMNVKDGYALELAIRKGYNVAIITGGEEESIRGRFESLGVKDIFLKAKDKAAVFAKYVQEKQLNPNRVLYMGDDLPDIPVMEQIALPCAPADATIEVKEVALYISPFNGGKGCVRDVISQTLRVQDRWNEPSDRIIKGRC